MSTTHRTQPLRPQFHASRHKGAGFAELVRPQTFRVPVLVYVVAGVRLDVDITRVSAGALLIAAACGLACALNDLADVEADRLNQRPRPLATGALTERDARVTSGVCAGVVIVSQLGLVQPAGLGITTAAVLLSFLYSSSIGALQRRGIVAHLVLAACYVGLPIILATSQGGRTAHHLLVMLVSTALIATGTLLHKDGKDLEGDRATGKLTPLARWGYPRVRAVSLVLSTTGAAIALITVGPGWWLAVAVPMLVTQALLVERPSLAAVSFHRLLYLATTLTLLAEL